MPLRVTPEQSGFGARVSGAELGTALAPGLIDEIRQAWLTYQVVSFADQPLTHAQLERFTLQFGSFGDDPYVAPVAEHEHILEVKREAHEAVPPFGSAWHSDWSFQATPPLVVCCRWPPSPATHPSRADSMCTARRAGSWTGCCWTQSAV